MEGYPWWSSGTFKNKQQKFLEHINYDSICTPVFINYCHVTIFITLVCRVISVHLTSRILRGIGNIQLLWCEPSQPPGRWI